MTAQSTWKVEIAGSTLCHGNLLMCTLVECRAVSVLKIYWGFKMFLGPSCLMMCPVTIPGSEQNQKSKNAIKKSIQLHIAYLKSGSTTLPPAPSDSIPLWQQVFIWKVKETILISRYVLRIVDKTGYSYVLLLHRRFHEASIDSDWSMEIVLFWRKNVEYVHFMYMSTCPQKGTQSTNSNNHMSLLMGCFPGIMCHVRWDWENASFQFGICLNTVGSEFQIQFDLFSLWIVSPAVITSLLDSKGKKEIHRNSNRTSLAGPCIQCKWIRKLSINFHLK